MSRAILIAGGVIVGGLALFLSRSAAAEAVDDAGAALESGIDTIYQGLGILRLSNMKKVTASHVDNLNMRAFLRVIRNGEGTQDVGGYSRLFGGGSFAGFADHPRKVVTKGGYTSTAAGAYQALSSSWDETREIMGLADFSPRSQDFFAVGRIAARGALDDVLAGRFALAVQKTNREWASLPGSPYGQPVVSFDRARQVFLAYGGNDSGVA